MLHCEHSKFGTAVSQGSVFVVQIVYLCVVVGMRVRMMTMRPRATAAPCQFPYRVGCFVHGRFVVVDTTFSGGATTALGNFLVHLLFLVVASLRVVAATARSESVLPRVAYDL